MTKKPIRYLAYMLRLWRVGGNDGEAWRASLESPQNWRQGFANLDALFAYLRKETGLGPDSMIVEKPPSKNEKD